jgi:light-regulated signal transduction histidine kinase (bacteriophytochrome)
MFSTDQNKLKSLPGIDEKYYKKIFQIFQTLRPRGEVESTGGRTYDCKENCYDTWRRR